MELDHLDKDSKEETDLAESHPAKLGELTGRLRKHIQNGGTEPWRDPHSENKTQNR